MFIHAMMSQYVYKVKANVQCSYEVKLHDRSGFGEFKALERSRSRELKDIIYVSNVPELT